MKTLCDFSLLCVLAVISVFGAGAVCGSARAENQKYTYTYKGKIITLTPSTRLVAAQENSLSLNSVMHQNGLIRDTLSEKYALKSRTLGIYRIPAADTKKGPGMQSLSEKIPSLMTTFQGIVQPVFEQGGSILIPSDEVIVGFMADTSLEQAEEYCAPFLASQGIENIRSFRKNAFIFTISNPSDGRAYAVAQYVAQLDGIRYAEPNHIVLRNNADKTGPRFNTTEKFQQAEEMLVFAKGTEAQTTVSIFFSADLAGTAPVWEEIASVDFEGIFLPAGWVASSFDSTVTQATWGRTIHRAHSGFFSAYCAATGTAAVAAPGPAPVNMNAVLQSPTYDLSAYEEVYVEAWFYTVNELYPNPGGYLYDAPVLLVWDTTTGTNDQKILAILAAGDCTQDLTTDNGWRKVLYRVPPAMRSSSAYFDFRFISNNSTQTEGAYLDDIRIIGSMDIDTSPLGNDTFGGRQYELRNMGQIAGLGTDTNDMHIPEAWELGPVSSSVVVAVIDDGVDLTHPDLNLVQGYDHDGTVGGGPKIVYDNHGTACAGNVGAISNNSLGVIGTAPGVKIMPIYSGTTEAEYADAFGVAVAQGAHVLSNSWGWVGAPSIAIEDAIDAALAADRTVVFAAGNGPDRYPWTYDVAFPANLTGTKDVIAVGASSLTDEHKGAASSDGVFSWGSSYVGSGPDIVAPGPWSYTTDRQGNDGYNDGSQLNDPYYTLDFGGTSSSTPKVTGIVALMLSANPDLTPAQIKSILRTTADDIDTPGEDDKTGAGRVNAYEAVQLSKQMVDNNNLLPISAIMMLLLN